ncbi:Retrovirus-related Pol polyprotein from transposon [Trichinella sp. T6]|nr:Retrovirus-related Pol polyprotein from transposon [Trichinella sp. T6]KRX78645.1 Retrovirus-related Pol polyprotein from transposon [Trichinella sp. T6]
MAENLHLVLNERGRVYNLKHTNMQDKLWVCRGVKKGCRGSIFTNLDVDAVLDCNPHADDCTPDNDILYKMEKKNSLKRRAAEELKTIPQIYHEEASSASADLETAGQFQTYNKSGRNYAKIDKEALAVIAGVKKFHEYLYGRQFTIITDHKPLLGLFVPKKETPQTLNYRHGKEIANADALSRLPKQSTENSGSHNPFILLLETIDISPLHSKDIARITAKDPIASRNCT